MEVHHVRKLGNLKGKEAWERQMIERRRKTMILCVECHDELHAGKLSEKKHLEKTGELTTRKRVRLVRGERSETYSSHGARRTALTLLLFVDINNRGHRSCDAPR
ncbi:hypothetical protein KSB_00760 [Ktedonobacter robiniae]|uniref:AI2M/AI1M-like HNH endonuclease domain-containing protein n=2 Tax=Ktedonobacter robiniae TaxID=2778365 RepID=A0ABQ3UFV9_9CHLR|nr:hypothetical protein KSB_00760 [Ktedonobacter robiniae]